MRVVDRGGGLNQSSVRSYNERLVMSLLRRHGHLSRVELCQHSGLSAQTVSVIVRALQRDDLLMAGQAQRGRVGAPSTPLSLNPDGAFALGVKVGLNSTDTVLIDFTGQVRHQVSVAYPYPRPMPVLQQVLSSLTACRGQLRGPLQERVVGVGIGLPLEIERWPLASWQGAAGDPWQTLDFETAVRDALDVPVYIQDDVTSAAGAELMFGSARELGDFAYFFVGSSIGSRLVLNQHIYAGRQGGQAGRDVAALADLERRLKVVNTDTAALWQTPAQWPDDWLQGRGGYEDWLAACGAGLATATVALGNVVEIDRVIVDGRVPEAVRDRLCAEVAEGLAAADAGATAVQGGVMGPFAKAIGAAGLPFHSRFMVEQVGLAAG